MLNNYDRRRWILRKHGLHNDNDNYHYHYHDQYHNHDDHDDHDDYDDYDDYDDKHHNHDNDHDEHNDQHDNDGSELLAKHLRKAVPDKYLQRPLPLGGDRTMHWGRNLHLQ